MQENALSSTREVRKIPEYHMAIQAGIFRQDREFSKVRSTWIFDPENNVKQNPGSWVIVISGVQVERRNNEYGDSHKT